MPVRLRRLLTVLCLTGALVGLEGIVQRLAGSNQLLFLVQPTVNKEAENQFGPYANRNNAAEYLNLLWPVCAGLAWLSAQAANRNRRDGLRKPGTAHLWLAPGAVVMGACPFISSSRGGSLVALGLLPVALIVMLTMTRGLPLRGKVGLGLLFAAAIQVAVVFGWDALEKRFETVFTDDLNGRLAQYKEAEAMAKDYQLFGSGAGTFASVYYFYLTNPQHEWSAYLHNDWLEFRITLGWIGFSLLLALLAGAFLLWFLGDGLPLPPLLTVLIFLALAGSLVHARFDFPFQVHSIATVFLLYCAILSCSRRPRE
jgi:O-antigen ligase